MHNRAVAGHAFQLVDLKSRIADAALRQLFRLAISPRTNIDDALGSYQADDEHRLAGYIDESDPIALVGFEIDGDTAVIRHIATIGERQRSGIGRQLITDIRQVYNLGKLTAQTDNEAVEFYRRCSFTCTSLGELYPGVERFECIWSG